MGIGLGTQQRGTLKLGSTISQPGPSGPYFAYTEESQELEVVMGFRGVFFGLLFEAIAAGVIVLIWWVI